MIPYPLRSFAATSPPGIHATSVNVYCFVNLNTSGQQFEPTDNANDQQSYEDEAERRAEWIGNHRRAM